MESGSVMAVPRRHKALAPWRFRRGFVRRQGKAAASDGGSGGFLEGFDGCSVSESCFSEASDGDGGGGFCEFETSGSNADGELEGLKGGSCGRGARDACILERSGSSEVLKSCGNGEAGRYRSVEGFAGNVAPKESNIYTKDCNLEGFEGNVASKESNMSTKDCNLEGFECNVGPKESNMSTKDCSLEGLESNGVTTEMNRASMPSKLDDLEGVECNGVAKESNATDKDCNSVGLMKLRKGRKALVPWRFQIGYKRPFAKAFCSGDASAVCLRQCTPAAGNNVGCAARCSRSSVRVSATCDLSSVKDSKETGSVLKKRKIHKDDHHYVMPNNGVVVTRESVMASLREFQIIYRKLAEEGETRWRETGQSPRPDLLAFKIFRGRFCVENNNGRYVGSVPGVQIGDVFSLRVELSIVGLHRPHRVGVDYIRKEDGSCVAVSIVSYGHPSDDKDNLDVLVYRGSMPATIDQKIDGTNLALKQSMHTNTPVRVIHGFVTYLSEKCQPKKLATYIYGGLYLVEKYWREKAGEDRFVCMFHLRRMVGQQHIDIQEFVKTKKPEPYYGIFMEDISQGLEKIPISVINSISNEYPVPFRYISHLQYPSKHHPAPPAGCDCVDGCSDSQKCACAMKNGGEIAFNDKGAILDEKPLVYECGPSCRCPPTCHNRVSQHGVKFRLQIFKTKSMGWGVRSLDFIPSGSFVCEYLGELLEDEEAEKRTNDEYLFIIGNKYYDDTHWEGLSRSIPSLQKGPSEGEEVCFAVDALNWGNLARFINHNCTPNLFPQNVLYDHDNKSMAHIMLFAGEDIPPLHELSYHYNYMMDQVRDYNGNIKKKKCLCGSIECTGWLY